MKLNNCTKDNNINDMKEPQEFWDSMRPANEVPDTSNLHYKILNQYKDGIVIRNEIERIHLNKSELKNYQLCKIKELVEIAWNNVPFYRDKYKSSGITKQDIDRFDWSIYEKLPIVTKDELIQAYPLKCLNNNIPQSDKYITSSSGSSGKTILIAVDGDALVIDTWQGIRQMFIQTNGHYNQNYRVVHIGVVPWWVDKVDGHHILDFISSLISCDEQIKILKKLKPEIISAYPSNMLSLSNLEVEALRENLKLIIVHSEQSSQIERDYIASKFGVPVLDEYSSEELTRIALQFPNKKYYVCEDTVRVDVINENTNEISEHGSGLLIGTNLLNKAMPFIKYIQGDMVDIGWNEDRSDTKPSWRELKKIYGRLNDSFILPNNKIVPSGTILDTICRWMFDLDLSIEEYEIVQRTSSEIQFNVVSLQLKEEERFDMAKKYFIRIFSEVFSCDMIYNFNLIDSIERKTRKRKPIRREF